MGDTGGGTSGAGQSGPRGLQSRKSQASRQGHPGSRRSNPQNDPNADLGKNPSSGIAGAAIGTGLSLLTGVPGLGLIGRLVDKKIHEPTKHKVKGVGLKTSRAKRSAFNGGSLDDEELFGRR